MSRPYNKLLDADKVLIFMRILRDSGVTNMLGAPPYLRTQFPGMTKQEAMDITLAWFGHAPETVDLSVAYDKKYKDFFDTIEAFEPKFRRL
tara:strand:+ start:535 stop:807 length:273 start_codon:yes stop_codon:yes gene_type:complete